jgi:hypothetical protein
MGCWGMGITQSDEYCEIYERFMEEYDEGKPLSDIKKDILDEYMDGFDANDGILHDVYFAIGKAEWMCGGISNDIYDKISHIIKSGANIDFYRELEATERDLKQRQKNLDRFLSLLSTPRGKTKKRKVSTEKYVKTEKPHLPLFRCGDVFAYQIDEKFRILSFVNRGKFYSTDVAYCYVWSRLYAKLPSVSDLTDERIMPLGYFTVETFPNLGKLKLIGNHPDIKKLDIRYPGILYEQWKPATWAIAKEEHLSEEYPLGLGVKFNDCLDRIQTLRETAAAK